MHPRDLEPAFFRPRWMRTAALSALLAAAACGGDATGPAGRSSPDDARFVTDDIARLWAAFDQMGGPADTLPLRGYLDAGTAGLQDFTRLRWRNARTLATMVWPRRAYYASVRANTGSVAALEGELRGVYRALGARLDGAVFPDVYFVVGGMATGGTTSEHGLLIGTEMFSAAPGSPVQELTPWEQSVVRPPALLPAIVAHELTHYQQHYGVQPRTLLEQSVREGSADFVGELLSGRTANEHLHAYGGAHEAELWREFSAAMDGTDLSRWLYNGGSITSTADRPADLGYYVGYRITQAYYERAGDKKQALRDILTISDFHAFLAASGYSSRF